MLPINYPKEIATLGILLISYNPHGIAILHYLTPFKSHINHLQSSVAGELQPT